jgi:hypothetical protein
MVAEVAAIDDHEILWANTLSQHIPSVVIQCHRLSRDWHDAEKFAIGTLERK